MTLQHERRGVPEHVGDRLERHPVVVEQRRTRVPKLVRRDTRRDLRPPWRSVTTPAVRCSARGPCPVSTGKRGLLRPSRCGSSRPRPFAAAATAARRARCGRQSNRAMRSRGLQHVHMDAAASARLPPRGRRSGLPVEPKSMSPSPGRMPTSNPRPSDQGVSASQAANKDEPPPPGSTTFRDAALLRRHCGVLLGRREPSAHGEVEDLPVWNEASPRYHDDKIPSPGWEGAWPPFGRRPRRGGGSRAHPSLITAQSPCIALPSFSAPAVGQRAPASTTSRRHLAPWRCRPVGHLATFRRPPKPMEKLYTPGFDSCRQTRTR